ncbi:hypothetical protein A3860_33860 [Niastella vici]|uniref:Uncharacterized protein n=1 Tax=Niastella vici TaxID=1703345 RepID=A0A1V9FPW9_9BACT|nr:hypothetical protein [Niastella vici]OQP60368.1 hypothetical protein A3860_33860 [Niastella vici]
MAQNQDDKTIEYITTTFQDFALADIKYNKDRPIAAALLSGCLLDQISGFFFDKGKSTDKARLFVKKYMPEYANIGIYDILRSPLVHNYSLPAGYSVTSDSALAGMGMAILPNGIIYIPFFIQDLEVAVNQAIKDLKEDKEIRKHALKWEKLHPVLKMNKTDMGVYSDDEIKRLEAYFIPKIQQHPIIKSEPLEWRMLTQELSNKKFHAFIEIKQLTGKKEINQYSLEKFVQAIGMESPVDYLESNPL